MVSRDHRHPEVQQQAKEVVKEAAQCDKLETLQREEMMLASFKRKNKQNINKVSA